MWVERLIKHFLSYFSLCPAPQWTLLFPSFSSNPTLHSSMGLHTELQMLSHLFLQDALWFETQWYNCWEKNNKPQYRKGIEFNSTIIAFHWKYYLKVTGETNKCGFSPLWHLPQSHLHDFFHTLNIILTLTFDSIVCKFASQMIFLPSSVLQTHHWMPPESLSVLPLPFWAVFKEQAEWDLFQTKWEWVCLVTLTGWKDVGVPGYSCILNCHPIWIWLNTFIESGWTQSQYFATT